MTVIDNYKALKTQTPGDANTGETRTGRENQELKIKTRTSTEIHEHKIHAVSQGIGENHKNQERFKTRETPRKDGIDSVTCWPNGEMTDNPGQDRNRC